MVRFRQTINERWRRGRSSSPVLGQVDRDRRQHVHLVLATVVLALIFWAILTIAPNPFPGLRVGAPSPVSVQADRTFSYRSTIETNQARLLAESDPSTIVYRTDPNVLVEQRVQLANLIQTISQVRSDPSLSSGARLERLASLPNSSVEISPSLALQIANLTDDQWRRAGQVALSLYDQAARDNNYVISSAALEQLRSRSLPYWAALATTPPERTIAQVFAGAFLRSNQVLDDEATRQRKEAAVNQVQPVMITIQAGESIVRQGDLVTPAVQEKLEASGKLRTDFDWQRIAGLGILASLLASIFGGYLSVARKGVWADDRSLLVVMGMVAMSGLLARLVLPLLGDWPIVFPLATVALLLTALFDGGIALLAVSILSIFVGVLADGSFTLIVGLLLGSAAGVFVVGRPARSLPFLLAGFAVGAATAANQVALSLLIVGGPSSEQLGGALVFGVINGAVSAILALGLYNIVGQLAGILTPFRLLELAHPSQPLIRRLMREAPGTYYHSIAVGNLAESAAEAVGADALLLRVAAYYHDVGKTIRPFFFTDNQSDRENVHNDLDPHTSARIIADHVREGIILAREARLPQPIIDFIATHHGTTVIKHFYQQALQQQDSVNIDDFRYPGPKPQTREQAILMLADSVEATVRSKAQHGQIASSRETTTSTNGRTNPSRQTLEELVNAIIDDRVRSGQLDQSSLNLKDLPAIRQAFLQTLQGIYHPRVDYAPQVIKTPEDRVVG